MKDNVRLLAALAPFALYASQMERQWSSRDDSVHYGVKREGAHQVTYGDFRRALRLYRELTGPPQRDGDGGDEGGGD